MLLCFISCHKMVKMFLIKKIDQLVNDQIPDASLLTKAMEHYLKVLIYFQTGSHLTL